MKTLKDHVILYDAECPMCSLYTSALVKSKMLEDNGRAPYQASADLFCKVDTLRAVNEIALINKKTGEVKYGIESLAAVISNSIPFLKPVIMSPVALWLGKKAYAFVSYNRRVIIPHDEAKNTFTIQPAYKKSYRILYILLAFFCTAFILSHYSRLLIDLIPVGGAYREYFICAGQVFFQAGVIAFIAPDKSPHYLGNMMTISFAGALLLAPVVIISRWIHVEAHFALAYFLLVALMMLLEHVRRTKLLAVGNVLSISWVLYRLLIILLMV